MIDIEKFICDVYDMASARANHELCHVLDYAFRKQGLEYKDGKIVNVEPNKEPKFKKGDWVVVNDGRIGRIIECTKDFADVDLEFSRLSTRVNNIRSWTIQDAKDGDVLADGNLPFIFKKIDSNLHSYAYCGISVDSGFKIDSEGEFGEWTWMQDIKPATQEQRDLLFSKMQGAGYEWDVENKQLKKIEPKKEELTGFEEIVVEIARTGYLNAYGVKGLAKFILSNAKKQLQQEFDKQLEQAYKNADEVQYRRGYRKAVEDAADFICNNMAGDDNAIRYFHTFMEQKLKELSQG